jgi:hypothetical protein
VVVVCCGGGGAGCSSKLVVVNLYYIFSDSNNEFPITNELNNQIKIKLYMFRKKKPCLQIFEKKYILSSFVFYIHIF